MLLSGRPDNEPGADDKCGRSKQQQIPDDAAGLYVTCSDLQRQVDSLQFGQIGTQAKPDHLSFVVVQLQPARRTPLGDFRDTAGQAVSHRLGVGDAEYRCLCGVEQSVGGLLGWK